MYKQAESVADFVLVLSTCLEILIKLILMSLN